MAEQLAGETRIGFNNAVRIVRTEGHRIQCQAGMDACYKAQEKGCDVLKQWDATLDGNTRESHSQVDGEIRELDKPFSNGLMFPGDPSGGAAEVINCRCALLQRASWELDEEELEELKKRAEYFGLDKSDSFEEYKQKYLRAAESQVEENSPKSVKNAKKGLISAENDGIISTRKAEFKRDFEAGKVPTIISRQKQARHIKGSKQFIEHEKRLSIIGDKPSYIREDFDETSLQRIVVSKLQGKVRIGADGSYREYVTCDEIVGYYYSKADGKYMPTKCAQVTYALGGGNIHIVPVQEFKREVIYDD